MEDDGKFLKKIKDDPAVPIGVTGLIGVVLYGIYNFKNRRDKTSVYLIHLRVAAQGTVIGCITLGLLYSICQKGLHKFFPDSESKNN